MLISISSQCWDAGILIICSSIPWRYGNLELECLNMRRVCKEEGGSDVSQKLKRERYAEFICFTEFFLVILFENSC